MIHIRRIFRNNDYALRAVKVIEAGKTVSKIVHGSVANFQANGQKFQLKIDYHKTQLQVPETNEDIYYILYFDIRSGFPFNFTDMMFKNALRIKQVSKNEFENLSFEELYNSKISDKLKPKPVIIFSLISGLFIAVLFIVSPYLFEKSDANNFAFIVGIASVLGFLDLIFFFRRKSTRQYIVRLIAFSVLSLIMLYFADIDFTIKLSAGLLALCILFLNLNSNIKRLFKGVMKS